MTINCKKNLLFAAYLLFNILLATVLMAFEYGYLMVALFVFGGHLRDLASVLYQLLNMKRVLKKCADVDGDGHQTVCCLVPVYTEDPSMLKQNLASLTTQNLSGNTTVLVVLLFDGLGEHNLALFDSVVDLVEDFRFTHGEERWYKNWRSGEDTRLTYNIGSYNGTQVILAYKEDNAGKKDSLIIGEKFITCGIPEISSIDVSRVDFIYHTDGDTISDENCLNEMLKSMMDDPNLDGVSGLLRAHGRDGATCTERGFVMMQDFQYFFSLIVRRMTESLLNSTTCLPGCSNMIRIGPRTDVAINKYGNLPTKRSSLIQAVTRMQGTDRRYTTLLLRQGSRLQMNWRAFVRTEPPLNAVSFVNQRRRWSSNSFFNSIILLYSSNIPLYIRASTLFDISRVFTTLFRFISYACFWIFISDFSVTSLVLLSVVIVLPYAYAFAWIACIVPEWKQMTVGFFLNKICMPFLSVVSVTKMFLTSTNFAWGSTTTTSTDDNASHTPMSPPGPVSSPSRTSKSLRLSPPGHEHERRKHLEDRQKSTATMSPPESPTPAAGPRFSPPSHGHERHNHLEHRQSTAQMSPPESPTPAAVPRFSPPSHGRHKNLKHGHTFNLSISPSESPTPADVPFFSPPRLVRPSECATRFFRENRNPEGIPQ